jgi:inner membrane protein
MDNLTHTFIGLAVGHAAWHSYRARTKRPAAAERLRVPFLALSAVANNFPDLDFVYARTLAPGKLGYMIHHRGYTHTLVTAPLQALLILACFALYARSRRLKLSRVEWAIAAALTAIGPLIHVGLDYLNSYGVHPFWPFDSRWIYGDAVFIAEPLIWLSIIPALLLDARSRFSRVFFGLLLAGALAAMVFSGWIPWQLVLIGILWCAWTTGLALKTKGAARALSALGAVAAVIALFLGASSAAREQLREAAATQFPRAKQIDAALSPSPANPFCWTVHTVELEDGSYVSRQGILAVAPFMLGAAECPGNAGMGSALPLSPVNAPPRPELLWDGEFRAPIAEFKELRREHCAFEALLHFSRVPAWGAVNGRPMAGDLRFARRGSDGFAKVELSSDPARESCAPSLPPWKTPIATFLK